MAVDVDERERLVTDLGGNDAMIMRNHGLLTVGRSVGEAWVRMWNLELACKIQVLAQSTGQELRQAPIEAIEKAASFFDGESAALEWTWLLRRLERTDPSYKE